MDTREQLLRRRKTMLNNLDDRSVEDILINLPVKSLMRFKCVSKSWQSFIEDPSFVQFHLSKSRRHPQLLITISNGGPMIVYSPKDGLKGGEAIPKLTIPWSQAAMLKPIDGLFCFVDRSKSATRIYNLATRQVTPWAQSSLPLQGGFSSTQKPTYGFGFDPLTNKYKILCVWEISRAGFGCEMGKVDHICEVFTVGEHQQWRRIDEVPPVVRLSGAPVYANGSIYVKNAGMNLFVPPDDDLIVAFDVGTEKFRVIQMPDLIVGPSAGTLRSCHDRQTNCLLEIDGHMAVMDRVDQYVVKLWISDDSYKEKKMTPNWTEETMLLPSSFLSGQHLFLYPVQGTDEIVIKPHTPSSPFSPGGEQSPRGFVSLYVYSRAMKSFREIQITGISPLLPPPFIHGTFVFQESLLPIQDARKKPNRPTPLV